MSREDWRNTLITELVGRTRDSLAFYQGLNDRELAGTGALLVYLRGTGSRTDEQLKTMSADDMRNTVIVEMHEQVHRSDLQSLTSMQLALTALGSHEVRGPDSLPEPQRPGQHTLVLRADRVFTWSTSRSFSDVPFLGPFIGRGTDCSHGWNAQTLAMGSGEPLVAVAGWGQVEGDGHPGASTDPCMSWVDQLKLDFDTRPFDTLPRKALDRAVLAYRPAHPGRVRRGCALTPMASPGPPPPASAVRHGPPGGGRWTSLGGPRPGCLLANHPPVGQAGPRQRGWGRGAIRPPGFKRKRSVSSHARQRPSAIPIPPASREMQRSRGRVDPSGWLG